MPCGYHGMPRRPALGDQDRAAGSAARFTAGRSAPKLTAESLPMIMPLTLTAVRSVAAEIRDPVLTAAQGFESISSAEMSETGLTVPDMNEPLSRYTVTVGCDGGYLPDPAAFAVAAGQAAWGRSASVVSAHLADQIMIVVTVTAPHRYAAVAVARAVVYDALKSQGLSSSQSPDGHTQHRAEPAA